MAIKQKKNKYSVWNNVCFFYKALYEYDAKLVWMTLLSVIGGLILPLFSIYIPKLMIDLVNKQVKDMSFILVMGGMVLAYALVSVFGLYMDRRQGMGSDYFVYDIIFHIFWKSLHIPYKDAEGGSTRKKYWDSIYTAGTCASRMYSAVPSLVIMVGNFLIYSSVISTLNLWIMFGLIILSFFNFLLLQGTRKYIKKVQPKMDDLQSKLNYINNATGDDVGAKDIRIFHLQKWIEDRADALLSELKSFDKNIAKKVWFRQNLGNVLGFLRDIVAYIYLIAAATSGKISAGDFVLYLAAIIGFENFVNGIINNVQKLLGASDQAQYYREYIDLVEENVEEGTVTTSDLKLPLQIEFSHVYFAYEEENILTDLTFKIEAGENIAIVGLNGAGKTTIVKLLCGLYEPCKGTIKINGIDIKEFAKKDLYCLFGAVFQDNRIFPFKVGENLTLQKQEHLDEQKAEEAIRKAGLSESFQKNNISLNDYMTHYFMTDGVVLSGGELQKFMIARAVYKDAPILVLDEPTAALDPISESKVYEKYAELTKGKTAIFVSHRLASTKFSDKIFFLKDGTITESGSHEQLMSQGGDYSHMFEIQASYYAYEEKGEY